MWDARCMKESKKISKQKCKKKKKKGELTKVQGMTSTREGAMQGVSTPVAMQEG